MAFRKKVIFINNAKLSKAFEMKKRNVYPEATSTLLTQSPHFKFWQRAGKEAWWPDWMRAIKYVEVRTP